MKVKRSAEHLAAVAILTEIQEHTGKQLTMRTVEKPKFISQRQADRLKAAQMLAAEILAAVERCEAWEREA